MLILINKIKYFPSGMNNSSNFRLTIASDSSKWSSLKEHSEKLSGALIGTLVQELFMTLAQSLVLELWIFIIKNYEEQAWKNSLNNKLMVSNVRQHACLRLYT